MISPNKPTMTDDYNPYGISITRSNSVIIITLPSKVFKYLDNNYKVSVFRIGDVRRPLLDVMPQVIIDDWVISIGTKCTTTYTNNQILSDSSYPFELFRIIDAGSGQIVSSYNNRKMVNAKVVGFNNGYVKLNDNSIVKISGSCDVPSVWYDVGKSLSSELVIIDATLDPYETIRTQVLDFSVNVLAPNTSHQCTRNTIPNYIVHKTRSGVQYWTLGTDVIYNLHDYTTHVWDTKHTITAYKFNL